ncbi:antitoxin VbhA family protein [Paracoccus aurantius]|uniref:antitoxin VbhA family protein n=1 Tax=Paracoccus aurantius TaxID=3073814 RepID=UPI0038FC2FBE
MINGQLSEPRYPTKSGAGKAGAFVYNPKIFNRPALPHCYQCHICSRALVSAFDSLKFAMVWTRIMRSKPASAAKASASPQGFFGGLIRSAIASQKIEGLELYARARADFTELEAGRVSLADLRARILGRYGLVADQN